VTRDNPRTHSASKQEGNIAAASIPRLVQREIRQEWSELWTQKIEDRYVAEDVARRDYELLFVDEGTVINASKDYAPPDLREILARNERILGMPLRAPDPNVGGMRKFARECLVTQQRWRRAPRRVPRTDPARRKSSGPPRQGGRGWLHRS
jgi:hypothetical protein